MAYDAVVVKMQILTMADMAIGCAVDVVDFSSARTPRNTATTMAQGSVFIFISIPKDVLIKKLLFYHRARLNASLRPHASRRPKTECHGHGATEPREKKGGLFSSPPLFRFSTTAARLSISTIKCTHWTWLLAIRSVTRKDT